MRGGLTGRVESIKQIANWLAATGALPFQSLVSEGRLSATTAVPVTTASVAGATSIFYEPYLGNRIALYDSLKWNPRTFAEIAIPLAGLVASTPYDIFIYDVAGVPTIETRAWTSATARLIALSRQDGILSKLSGNASTITGLTVANPTIATTSTSHGLVTGETVLIAATNTTPTTVGSFVVTVLSPTTFSIPVNVTVVTVGTGTFTSPLTRRYLGSVYVNASGGQTDDSLAKRYLWNNYNRVFRPMRVQEAAASWNYSTAAARVANGNTANQLDFMVGIAEDAISAEVSVTTSNSTANTYASVGIGEDTAAFSTNAISDFYTNTNAASFATGVHSSIRVVPAIGRHTLVWLETGNGTATQVWSSNQGGIFSGISGMWRA